MRKFKKFIALLMTVMMFISMLPMDALAEIIAGGGNASEGKQIPIAVLSVKPPVATHTYIFMNGTTEFARQIVKNGETLNNPGTPSYPVAEQAANKEFTGWYIGEEKITFPYTASVGTTSDTVTVNARFDDVYFVFFTNPAGEVMVTKKDKNGATISTEGVTYPVDNEESIVGWQDESGNLVSSVTLNGSDVTLTAKVENGHWITYDSQGGTYVAPAFVKGNGTTTAPAAPTRPGYTFDHWSETVGGEEFTFGQLLDRALTLYAVWTPNTRTQYTVIHWQENADNDEYSYAESETKYGTTGAQTSAAAKSYTGFTAQTIAQQTIAGDGSTIVNVYYKRNVYEVKFFEEKSGQFPWSPSTWEENTSLRITAKHGANIRAKWPIGTFWYVSQNNQNTAQSNLDTMPIGGKNFYGKASGNGKANYYVEVLPGESGTETVGGKTYKLDHTDTGYTRGTVTDEERYEMTGFTCNVQYSAKNGAAYNGSKFYYDRNSYNIVYVSGGKPVDTASKKFEQSIADAGSYTPPVKPVGQEDYVFGGWYADEATTKPYDFTGKTMPAQNVTVYAKWNKPVYNGTIYLTLEGTGSSITLNVPKGDTIETALNEKQAEIMAQVGKGYTWRGWRTGKDGTGEPFNPQTRITTDVTLYPYYTKDGTFTVEYVSGKNDVTAPEDGKSYAEDSFADLMSPGKLVADDGEYFLGWSDGAATYQPRDKYQIKSNHANERNVITLTAQWGARPAGTTLTYKANGGTGADVVENLANNATVTTRPANTFSRVGYTFKGWDTDPKGEGSIAPNTQVQVDNKDGENVLYAIWSANTDTKYTVEFYYQNVDGTYTLNHSDKRTATTDTTVSVTDADKAAKENNKYVFEADNKNNVLSGNVAGDGSLVLKLYFKLNTASYTIHHYLLGTTTEVAKDETGTMKIGETLTATSKRGNRKDIGVYSYTPSQEIEISAGENVITVYYVQLTAVDVDTVYDGDSHAVIASIAGVNEGDYKIQYRLNGTDWVDFLLERVHASESEAGETIYVRAIPTNDANKEELETTANLKVTKRPVTLTSESASKPYDGTPLTRPNVTVGGMKFVDGEVSNIKAIGSVTNVSEGKKVNSITYEVDTDKFNEKNYTITKIEGELEIIPITDKVTVKIFGNTNKTTYDGDEKSASDYGIKIEGSNQYTGADFKFTGDTKEVKGTDAGTYNLGLKAEQFENLNKNFTNVEFVIERDTSLTINPRPVTLTSETASKEYDGTPLTKPDVTVTGDGFVAGEVSDIKATGSVTLVDDGEVTNAITFTTGEKFNEKNYTITKNEGKLSITKRTDIIVITTPTRSRAYNGKKLLDYQCTYTGTIADGDELIMTFPEDDGLINAGSKPNQYERYRVERKSDGRDVTNNYTFGESIIGTLTVTSVAIELTAASASKAYDGTPLTNSNYTISKGAFVSGEGLAAVTIVGSQTLVGASANTITGHTLKDNTLAQNYTITYQPGELTVTQNEKAITVTANSNSWEYDGQAHSDGGYTVNYDGVDYKVEAGETATLPTGDTVTATVEGTVTNVADSADDNNVVTNVTIANKAGTVVNDQYKTITTVNGGLKITWRGDSEDEDKKVKITAADNTVEYDGSAHGAKLNAAGQIELGTSYTVTNLAEGHSVKTLAIEGSETDAGVYADKLVPGNAVIVDGNGVEVTANYDITYVPGALTITRRGEGDDKVVLTAADNTVVYDGQPHGAKLNAAGEIEAGTSYTITNLADGHKVQSVVISGSETAVGEYENRLVPSGAKIVDAEGNDVTRNYVVGYKNGKLTITSPDTVIVTIKGKTDTVEYDGQKHEVNGYEVVSISNTLYTEADFGFADGATAHAEGTDAGDYFMNLTKDSFVNRNANFSAVTFVVEDGKLTITKRGLDEKNLVKIIAADNTVYYDGQPHGAKLNAAGQIEVGTSYTTEYLALGHKVLTVAIDGSETMVGVYENMLVPNAAIIVDENDNDVTRNYVITYVPGTLEIRRNETEIKVTANSHTWEYDGQPHSDGGYTVTYGEESYTVKAGEFATLPTGDKVTATVEGSVTNVADSADDNNVVTNVTITNEAGAVVNDQYKTITRVNGGLKITRRGDSEDEDRKVKIIAEPNTVEYDGSAHGAKLNAAGEIELDTSYTTVRLVEGHYVDETTLDITGSQTNVGVYEEELKPAVKAGATEIVIRDANDNDVTANYALTLVNATLTITGDKLIPDKKAEDENIESNYKLGDKIEFTITVKNVSIYDVENVIATDANAEIQAGDGYTVSADKHTATIAIITAKNEIRIKALHTVTSEDILAGKVGNVANVTWKDGETTVTKTVDDDTTKLTPPDVTLNVTKTSDWEGKATGAKLELGTKITYTITVKNTGNVPYTNVNFTDLLQNGDATVTGEIPTYGTLAVNEEKSFTVEYIVTEADLLKESINNKVTAEADEIEYTYYEGEIEKTGKATPKGEAEVGDRTDDAKASTISTKTTTSTPANGKGYALGETIRYDIKVTNDGNLTVTDIEVVDNLEGAEIKAGNGYDVVNGKAVIAELKPGESVTVKVEYVVTEADILAGKVVNDATVTGKGPGTDPEPDEPTTDDPTDEPKATLEIVKAVEGNPKNGTSYALGEKITYTLTVSVGANNNVTVKDIKVTDKLLTRANVDSGAVEIAGGYTLNEKNEIELPDMAPGADDVVITYTYKVQASDLGENGQYGTVHNAATVQGATPDPDPENPNLPPDDPTGEDDEDKPTSIKLTITANDNTVKYDGKPHGGNGYTDTGVASGHEITGVTISGSQTNAGTYEGELVPGNAKIEDADGKDVTSHYEITYMPGTLKITKGDINEYVTLTTVDAVKVYDGTSLAAGAATAEDKNGNPLKIEYSVDGGNWTTDPSEITATEVKDSKTIQVRVSSEGNYEGFVTGTQKLTITKRKLTISINNAEKKYNGAMQDVRNPKAAAPFTNLEYTYTGLADTDTISYLDVVYGPDKNTNGQKYAGRYDAVIGEDENGNRSLLITNKDTTASAIGNYEIEEIKGELIITQAEATVIVVGGDGQTVYNGQLQVLPVITHIETSGTPPVITPGNDRYIVVTGLMGDDKLADGTLRYQLAGTDANCTQPDAAHVIEGKDIKGKFIDPDGNAYSNNSMPYDATQTRPTVLNGEVDVSANYFFTYQPGNFYIMPRPVTITANSNAWTYDAQKHTESGVTASGDPTDPGYTGLVSGHVAEATMTAESYIIDAGTQPNVIATKDGKPQVTITANGVDVTANYVITTKEGTLKVFKRGDPDDPNPGAKPVKIIAADNEVPYDDNMHGAKKDGGEIVEGVSFTKENFVEGHAIQAGTVTVTGEAKLVGTYENLLVPGTEESVRILDAKNNDVTRNYHITFVPGKLTITGQQIDPTKEYDTSKKYDLGDEIPFTITVRNVSKETVFGVRVEEKKTDAKIVGGSGYRVENGVAVIASIAPEGIVTVNAVHIVTADDLDNFWNNNQGYTNTALVSWPNGAKEVTKEVEDFADPAYTYELTKEIVATPDHPDVTKPYYKDEVVTFKITVRNTGNMRQTIQLTEDGSGLNGATPDLKETSVTLEPKGSNSSKTVFATVKIDETILAIRNGDAYNRIWADNGKGKDDSVKFADATLPLPALHNLTIKYVLENGNPIPIDPASAWKFETELRAGEKYSRLSPVLNNLETDTPLVEGVMPDHDLEITVIYTGNGGGGGDNPGGGGGEEEPKKENERDTTIRIRDYETPLGLSNVFMNAGDCFE